MFKKYTKRLEKLFRREEIGRKQLNFACDARLITQLKLLAKYLETPLYPLAEHILQLGMSEVAVILNDSTWTEKLQRHLLQKHLLVEQLNPIDSHVSERARRFSNALKLLKFIEYKAGSLETVEQIINKLRKEA